MTDASRYCGGRTREGGKCRRPAGWGTPHPGLGRCKLHAGSTPAAIRSAERKRAEAEALKLLEQLGRPDPLGNPVEELMAVGAEIRSWLAVTRERMTQLSSLELEDRIGVERERALVRLYAEALDRAHRFLADVVRLGIEGRRVQIQEDQARRLFEAVMVTFRALELPPEIVERGRRVLAAEMRGLSA